MAEVPGRLLRQGREPDPDFLPSEHLFRRVPPNALEGNQLLEAAIAFPDFSVNREKYSLPEDVLLGHPEFRIFTFQVQDVPLKLTADVRVFTFRVEHDPEEDNYAHSEVRTYSNGARAAKKPPNSIKTEFRLRLGKAARILPTSALSL